MQRTLWKEFPQKRIKILKYIIRYTSALLVVVRDFLGPQSSRLSAYAHTPHTCGRAWL